MSDGAVQATDDPPPGDGPDAANARRAPDPTHAAPDRDEERTLPAQQGGARGRPDLAPAPAELGPSEERALRAPQEVAEEHPDPLREPAHAGPEPDEERALCAPQEVTEERPDRLPKPAHAGPEPEEERALRVVRELGADPTSVERLGGVVNTVLRVLGPKVDWVVRTPVDPQRPDEFPVEQWAVAAVRSCGVPVPEVLHVGVSYGLPVMVSRYVRPSAEPITRPWWWLGRHATAVARASLDGAPDGIFSRFGRDLDRAWEAHLAYNQDALTPDDPLLADGGYRHGDQPMLRRWLHDLDHLDTAHGLVHGDLAPRNLVSQGADTAPVLIDWGTATTGPAPWTELQRAFHAVVVDGELPWEALADLADGTGTDLTATALRTLRNLTALRLLDLARWAHDQRPDLYPAYRDTCASGLATLVARGPD